MPLLRDIQETTQPRVQPFSDFGKELLHQGAQCLLSGDMDNSPPSP